MPRGPLPSTHLDLLDRPVMGQLATVDAQGRPQVNPVWFLYNQKHIQFSVKGDTQKLRNMRANKWVALSMLDPDSQFRYLEVRGRVVMVELFKTLTFVNQLAQKYTGEPFTGGHFGEERYRITIAIDSWSAASE